MPTSGLESYLTLLTWNMPVNVLHVSTLSSTSLECTFMPAVAIDTLQYISKDCCKCLICASMRAKYV